MIGTRRPIRPMSQELALKIAAGEVVERPASVVKELIENAVDAGASRISIEVRESGLKLIRVADDGCGIPRPELALAFAPHATSKVAELDDLESLATLGFRGEALAAIAAVSRVELRSRTTDADIGGCIRIEFGNRREETAGSAPPGVRISVSDLFDNVPARRKFVRSLRAEAGQIQNVVMQYALAQPGIAFSLRMDDRPSFESPGTRALADALAAVYGPRLLQEVWPVEGGDEAASIAGLISQPSFSRATRAFIHIAVNGRPIQNRTLGFALEEAYSGFLMTGRHPLAIIHLALPRDEIDCNIHPSKHEVRFSRSREVHATLHRTVAATLLERRLAGRVLDLQTRAEPDEAGRMPEPVALPLPSDGPETGPAEEHPLLMRVPLRIFGQTRGEFIIAEGPSGLYMIDQHAAHERILFDRLEAEFAAGEISRQVLLEPVAVELEPRQLAALEENHALLLSAGFELEPFGASACLVRSIPALAAQGAPGEVIREVLSEIESVPEPSASRERALAAMACKGAVKAGQTLGLDEMRELVLQLECTPRPGTCPHGRPTMIHLSHSQLEREFGRR